jgi:hypothetical protein
LIEVGSKRIIRPPKIELRGYVKTPGIDICKTGSLFVSYFRHWPKPMKPYGFES